MVNGLNLLFQFLDSFAFIVLAAAGLAIIFGIMGVINLAHGEFIMVGAYATTLANIRGGLPLPVAMLVGVAVTAVFGLVVERVVISGTVPNALSQRFLGRKVIEPLYDRLADSMVATWGLSLIMVQGVRIVLGNSLDQIGTPLGNIAYSGFSYSTYRVLLSVVALGVLALTYYVFTRTEYGMRARATIQDEDTARALGVDTERTYMTTFAIGSGLAGLTGALYAPTITMVPGLGSSFLVEAFVAVVVGGPSVVLGTTLAGGLLGAINAAVTNLFGTFFGRIALLVTAIVMIRFLPDGITGFVETVRERRQEGA
ncbi:urea ABC transporter, permease protein UrtB [Halomicroarcula sp. F13]|uniref:Urea ABC transporter, permease protein UrtB n=1 Tax=Haloarcula rubra TaxID=2487747 RepID=A0AAW4PM11_9EURY|nr:urea ABC transporter, permease protein UrtB [Halomicroarcula rubra]MBX0322181.1 urea ABC transporter, permease protein UrtB [Halomicroarcula rubra]